MANPLLGLTETGASVDVGGDPRNRDEGRTRDSEYAGRLAPGQLAHLPTGDDIHR